MNNITKKYMEQQGLTASGFTRAVNAVLPASHHVSRQSVGQWLGGTSPDYRKLIAVWLNTRGWLMDWAIEYLDAADPELLIGSALAGRTE